MPVPAVIHLDPSTNSTESLELDFLLLSDIFATGWTLDSNRAILSLFLVLDPLGCWLHTLRFSGVPRRFTTSTTFHHA